MVVLGGGGHWAGQPGCTFVQFAVDVGGNIRPGPLWKLKNVFEKASPNLLWTIIQAQKNADKWSQSICLMEPIWQESFRLEKWRYTQKGNEKFFEISIPGRILNWSVKDIHLVGMKLCCKKIAFLQPPYMSDFIGFLRNLSRVASRVLSMELLGAWWLLESIWCAGIFLIRGLALWQAVD